MVELLDRGARAGSQCSGAVEATIGSDILVGIAMGLPTIPLLTLLPAAQTNVRHGAMVTTDAEGRIAEETSP